LQAAQEARANGLLVAFSCCATNEFVSAANLERYATVCKQAGASFIQVLEPEAVGHYAGKAVQLTAAHQKTLEAFFYRLNFDPRFAAFPVVSYPALVKREAGCQGKGLHYLYVDAEGFVQSCPFCRKKLFHATDIHLGQRIRALRSSGCQVMDWKVPPIGPDRAKEPPGQLKQWLSAVPEA
jgi:MoaA/NifB/PqqE/SkfB family radical SAM enzyme